jgi:hypothetical protein
MRRVCSSPLNVTNKRNMKKEVLDVELPILVIAGIIYYLFKSKRNEKRK